LEKKGKKAFFGERKKSVLESKEQGKLAKEKNSQREKTAPE